MIDPRRDCDVYLDKVRKAGARVTHIFETHRNEDYAIGSMEVAERTGAKIFHGSGLDWDYGEELDDGRAFSFGSLELKAIHTPGHTDESMSYALYDKGSGDEAVAVFTGDALFVGDVGRTDLPGPDKRGRLSYALFDSIHKRLLPLGDGCIVYPGHGAGSVCGGDISERPFSTIGLERKQNPMLQLDEVEFVRRKMEERLDRPPYFRRMEVMNLRKHLPMSGLPEPAPLTPKAFSEAATQGALVIDVRMPHSVAGAFIRGATSIWLDGLAVYAGWLLPYDRPLLLVTEDPGQLERAVRILVRIGYDNIAGYLRGGMSQWTREGMPYETLPTLNVEQAKDLKDKGQAFFLDPRPDHEWDEIRVPGTKHIFVGELEARLEELPRLTKLVCMCSAGFRGGMAAVMLHNLGFENTYNVLGGIGAWKAAGYPTEG